MSNIFATHKQKNGNSSLLPYIRTLVCYPATTNDLNFKQVYENSQVSLLTHTIILPNPTPHCQANRPTPNTKSPKFFSGDRESNATPHHLRKNRARVHPTHTHTHTKTKQNNNPNTQQTPQPNKKPTNNKQKHHHKKHNLQKRPFKKTKPKQADKKQIKKFCNHQQRKCSNIAYIYIYTKIYTIL